MRRGIRIARRLALGLMAVLTITSAVVSGCADNSGISTAVLRSPASNAASNANPIGDGVFSYPVPDIELTLMNESAGGVPDRKPIEDEYEKRTGIRIRHLGGAPMTDPKFRLLLASKELPDIFMNTWLQFPGGPEQAVEQGYIVRLNDYIDRYAPNFKKMLEANPEIDKMIKTDDGTYYAFPFIRSEGGRVYGGPIIRKDWLDELGLPIPETIDEWHTVLKAFKEKKNASSPITFRTLFLGERTGGFAGAFGVMGNFYLNDGKVVYGYLEPHYKDYLATMRRWYAEGLIDRDFALIDGATVDEKMLSGASGATIGWQFYIEKYNLAVQASDAKPTYVAAPYPTLVKGTKPEFGQLDNAYAGTSSAAVSVRSNNIEAAMRWLDYAYTEEGMMLNTYGIEGVTYEMIDDKPVFTDLVVNNPDGLGSDQVMQLYANGTNFPMIQQDNDLPTKYRATTDSIAIWRDTNHAAHLLPPVTPTAEEADEMAAIMNEINLLVKEAELKIILGTEPLDAYDDYVERMKAMGIDRALEIQQAAYERYLRR